MNKLIVILKAFSRVLSVVEIALSGYFLAVLGDVQRATFFLALAILLWVMGMGGDER